MNDFEKKKELFLKQKETLVKKMGMESVAEEISKAEK